MKIVTLTGAELVLAAQAGCMRQVTAIRSKRTDFYAQDGNGSNKWQPHIIGALGEMAVAKHLNIYWSGTVGQIDCLDVGPFEVRTRDEQGTGVDLTLRKKDAGPTKFILVVANPPDFELVGWLPGDDGVQDCFKKHVRGVDLFFIPKKFLRPMEELDKVDGVS